jgi:uncharacterized protein YjiS (DUF1127 family)
MTRTTEKDMTAIAETAAQAAAVRPGFYRFFAAALSAVHRWASEAAERRRQRLVLAAMEDWQLRDIGLSRTEARREAEKWPWAR